MERGVGVVVGICEGDGGHTSLTVRLGAGGGGEKGRGGEVGGSSEWGRGTGEGEGGGEMGTKRGEGRGG